MRGAEEQVREFTKCGYVVHKVTIKVEEFLDWASQGNIPTTSVARSDFANLSLGKEITRRQKRSEGPTPTREEVKRVMQQAKGLDLPELWEPYLRRPKASICPIFRDRDSGPEHFGSGVLIKVGHAHFLLTVAHVTDERQANILLIPSKTGFVNLFGLFLETKLPSSGSRNDDRSDVAVVRLPEEPVDRLHEHLIFLDHDDYDLADSTAPKDAYTIVRFPARRSETKGGFASTDQFSLSGEGVMDRRFEELGSEPHRHLIVQFRNKRAVHYSTMLKTQSPHPAGMSGGGMFAWSKDLPKLSALAQPRLVAILTEYHPQKNVFVGTRLHSHLMAIHRKVPALPIVPIRR